MEEVLRELQDGMRVLDLCTGSGCILLSILKAAPGLTGLGTDLSGAGASGCTKEPVGAESGDKSQVSEERSV